MKILNKTNGAIIILVKSGGKYYTQTQKVDIRNGQVWIEGQRCDYLVLI